MAQIERESKLQRKIMNILRENGCYVYKNAQNMFTEKGRPDLTACVPVSLKTLVEQYGEDKTIGLFVGIELKREGHLGEVSQAQEIVGRQIMKSSGYWFAIDDADVIKALMIKWKVNNNAV